MAPNISARCSNNGRRETALRFATFNPASPSIMPISNAITEPSVTNGSVNTTSQQLARGRAHHDTFGHIAMPPVSAFYGVKEFLNPDILLEIEASAILDIEIE